MRIGYTLTEALLEIWPIDKWSREKILAILGKHQIGFDVIPTTMDTYSFRFRNKEDYYTAKHLIDTYENL